MNCYACRCRDHTMDPATALRRLSMIVLDAPTLRVLNYCYRWGVGVVFGSPPPPRANHAGNNSRGLFTIYDGVIWRDPAKSPWFDSPEEPIDLLHELSHVLDGSPTHTARELSGPMLALDYYGTRWLKLFGRRAWMRDFGVDGHEGAEWGDLCVADKHDYLQRSLKKAVRRGLLTADGKPTFHRRKRKR